MNKIRFLYRKVNQMLYTVYLFKIFPHKYFENDSVLKKKLKIKIANFNNIYSRAKDKIKILIRKWRL